MFPCNDQTFDVGVAVGEVVDPIPHLPPSAIVDALDLGNGSDLRIAMTEDPDPSQESDVIGEVVIAVANVTKVVGLAAAAAVVTGIDATRFRYELHILSIYLYFFLSVENKKLRSIKHAEAALTSLLK